MAALNFDVKKTVMAVVGAGVLGLAGWLAWDMFMAPPPPPPPPPKAAVRPPAPKPAVQAEVSPDKLIDEVMAVSGLQKQIEATPDRVAQGARMGLGKSVDPAAAAEIEKIVKSSYAPEHFLQRVRDALKKDFERKRVEALLKMLNTPLMKKMTELESRDPKEEELAAFAKGIAAKPLPKERVQLLRQYNEATRTTDFAMEAFAGSARASAMGVSGGDAKKMAEFDKGFDKQRAKAAESVRNYTMVVLAYLYRDVSDAELGDYIRFSSTDEGKWFVSTAMGAMLEEYRASAQRAGERIAEWAKARKPAAAAAPGKAGVAPAVAATGSRALTARSKLDARECLKRETNQAIHRCAEGYR